MNYKENVVYGFKAFGSLTVTEAIGKCHTTELRKAVSDLKNEGYTFESIWEPHEGGRHKRYFMTGEPDHA